MKHDDISSTEKLLDHIRKQSPSDSAAICVPEKTTSEPSKRQLPFSFRPLSKHITVGVDIAYTELRMVRIHHLPDEKYELLDFINIPFALNITLSDKGFISFLKDALKNFCGVKNRYDLWSTISSVKVETRCIRIPKLPKKQIPNAVYWVFSKEVPFKKDEEILDFKILGDVTEDGVTKTEVMTYTAPRKEVYGLKRIFSEAGFPLAGISIVPFAVQNLLQTVMQHLKERDICQLSIGIDSSRIAIYSEGRLVLSRGIKSGIKSMILCISDAIKTDSFDSAKLSLQAYKKILTKDRNAGNDMDDDLAHKIFFNFIRGARPISRVKNSSILSEEQIFSIIRPAIDRLIRQVERTFDHFSQNFKSEGLAKVMVSGPLTANEMIIRYLRKQLDLQISIMDPFPPETTFVEMVRQPETLSQREAFVAAIGIGLSRNSHTPNFLFTHADLQKEIFFEKVNRGILMVCIVTLLIFSGIYLWQTKHIKVKNAQVANLTTELNRNSPEANKKLILKLFSRSKQQRDRFRTASKRFAPLAFLEEVSQLTPSNIRLISYLARRTQEKPSIIRVTLDGVIFGDRTNFEATLSNFMLHLKNSPLFQKSEVNNKRFEFFDNQEVLRFSVTLNPA